MRVIVTGGTGLIGSALTSSLVSDGHSVVVLSRYPDRKSDQVPAGAEIVGWDARTADAWHTHAEAADAIVNLAGLSLASGRWTASRKRQLRESRLHAGEAVVDAIRRVTRKPGVVIQASGADYYGSGHDRPLGEDDPPGDSFLARLTVEWEASTSAVREVGVRHVVTRSGVVFARDALVYRLMTLPFRLFVGGQVGSGRQWLSWIHVADEIRAIRHLIEHQASEGAYNLSAPQPVTNAEFSAAVGRVLGRPSFFKVPGFVLRAALGEMASLALAGQRAMPRRLLDEGFEFRYPTLSEALQAIED